MCKKKLLIVLGAAVASFSIGVWYSLGKQLKCVMILKLHLWNIVFYVHYEYVLCLKKMIQAVVVSRWMLQLQSLDDDIQGVLVTKILCSKLFH